MAVCSPISPSCHLDTRDVLWGALNHPQTYSINHPTGNLILAAVKAGIIRHDMAGVASQDEENLLDQVALLSERSQTAEDDGDQGRKDEQRRAEDLSLPSGVQPPLLRPVASRMISCLRAPCLKRLAFDSSSPQGSMSPASGTMSPEFGTSPSAHDMSLSTVCSFAAIKKVASAPPKRQVHFDAAPPEAGITHSRDNYDRRPIECTRGGSSFDLSLPPRGMCPSYSGEADNEACEEVNEEEDSRKERIRGFSRWARLKNGGTILGGATLKLPVKAADFVPSSEERDPNVCRLPVHGIRSFGGLAGSIGHSEEVHSIELEASTSQAPDEGVESAADAEQDGLDSEHAAFRQAVYAALSMSPNATPMPSPSVRTRWECVTSYFDQARESDAGDVVEVSDRSGATTPDVKTERAEEIAPEGEADQQLSVRSEDGNEAVPAAPFATANVVHTQAKVSPSPSIETSTNASSSPMSSRCSSTDTWSSQGFADCVKEADAFESAFAKSMAELSTTAMQPSDEHYSLEAQAARGEASSPSDATDSADYEQGMSSSRTGCGDGWMSSCGTSPDLHPSEGPQSPLINKYTLDVHSMAIPQRETSTSLSTLSALPAFLAVQRRAVSQSAPPSAAHSPCHLSADEGEEESRKPSSRPRRPTNSGHKARKAKRTTSNPPDSPADSDDAIPRARRCTGERSKSMSSAFTTLKKSPFSTCSFRSEFEDEGALGGF